MTFTKEGVAVSHFSGKSQSRYFTRSYATELGLEGIVILRSITSIQSPSPFGEGLLDTLAS